MKFHLTLSLVVCFHVGTAFSQITQQPGTNFLIVEAEAFEDDEFNDEFVGWATIDPTDPLEVELDDPDAFGLISIPPASSNVSGRAIFDQKGKTAPRESLGYSLQFENPGTYYMYVRYSLYDMKKLAEGQYGNENSFFAPFESIDQDPVDPELEESRNGVITLSNVVNGLEVNAFDGCRIADEPWLLNDVECDEEELRGEQQLEGQYHWQPAIWGNDLGHANYEIDRVGAAVDFYIAGRERGTSIDMFLFSQDAELSTADLEGLINGEPQDPCDFDGDGVLGIEDLNLLQTEVIGGANNASFDINQDGQVDGNDFRSFVKDPGKLNSYIGDANLDGEFNSGDLVAVFEAGLFESGQSALWSQGDWTGNGTFDSSDFVAAFQDGGFELGPRAAVAATVPEPSALCLMILGMLTLLHRNRRS